jgi:hypothetical protein
VHTPLVSSPGARLRIARTGQDGEVGRLLLWCVRRGVPLELVEAPEDVVTLDGERLAPAEARRRLSVARPA